MAKPEDKPMKMQWVEIDGRSTPIVLPQIWDHDKEDWIVTSTDNPLPTQVTGSYTEESVSHQRMGIIPAGTSETLFDFPNRRVELQSLSMGSNSKFLQIRIFFYKKDGSVDGSLKVADRRGTNLHDPTASAVQLNSSGENDFWAVRNYDEQNNEYALTMKRSLTAFSGMGIVIHNPESTEKNVAVNAFTSIWKGA